MKTLQTYYQCWLEVVKQKRYQDKWLTDETYFRAIKAQFPSLEALGFDRGMMNKAISSYGGETLDDFTESNKTGRFRRAAKGVDPFDNPKRKIWGYFITTPGGLVQRPPDGKKSFLSLLQDETLNDRYSVARGLAEVIDLTTEIAEQSCAKRKAEAQLEAQDETKKPKHGPASARIVVETYWDSPEAKKLFLGNASDDRDVVKVLEERIERLQQANRSVDGWKDIIDKHDKDHLCSSYDVFIIRQRCSILCLAYMYALEEMNSARWVEDCCAQAISDSSKVGIDAAATNERTVAGWNILLRANREHFPLPNPRIHKQKNPLPDLLEYFQEEVTLPWLEYCIENLADLTVELARNELNCNLIPKAATRTTTAERSFTDNNEETKDDSCNESAQEDNDDSSRVQKNQTIRDCLLQVYLEFPISLTTTWRWLRRFGFSYDARKKSFFVDGHERPNVVFKRNEFCTLYLTKLEPRAHRWIQVTKQTVERWKRENKVSVHDTEDTITDHPTQTRTWLSSMLMTLTYSMNMLKNWDSVLLEELECPKTTRYQASHDLWPR
ncbi:hypothetical protein MHU86_5035 [Fragilaria crotonensis]|nr:hypothetical protein MHU86_5035 [Fragilaria crotonensis]